jgi:phosphoglycerol transferase
MKIPKLSRSIELPLTYFGGAFLSLFLFFWLAGGFQIHPEVPFAYDGDILFSMTLLKSLVHGEWFPFSLPHSEYLGVPYGMHMADFPEAHNLHYLFIYFLSLFTKTPAGLYNGYYLLTFPLSTLCFIYAAKRFRIPNSVALVFGLLFSFLPFHLLRFAHLFLAAYFIIPLCLMVTLQIGTQLPLLFRFDSATQRYKLDLRSKRSIEALVVAFLAGTSGVYYAYFFSFFAVVAAASACLYRRKWIYLLSGAMLIGTLAFSAGLSILPNFIYKVQHGKNSIIATRSEIESETYGLKLKNIFTPRGNHRIPAIARIRAKHTQNYSDRVEGSDESIGLVAVAGFFLLLCQLLYLNRARSVTLSRLALFQVSGTSLAVIGGFGIFVASLLTSKIRCYNRISVYLACIALFGLAFAFKDLRLRMKPIYFYLLLFSVLCFGLFDQLTPDYVSSYAAVRETYESDQEFFKKVQATMPKNSMILQLPFMIFPESAPIVNMTSYSHFRGYLHSDGLKWSYGAVHGRPGSAEIENLSRAPLNLKQIQSAGYQGIYIDRYGYADQGKGIEENLIKETGHAPLISANGRMSFFKLSEPHGS